MGDRISIVFYGAERPDAKSMEERRHVWYNARVSSMDEDGK